MSWLCHSCDTGAEGSALDHLADTGAVLLGLVFSYAHLCHFSGNKAPCSLPCWSMDLGHSEDWCMHTQVSSKLCKEWLSYGWYPLINSLTLFCAPIEEPLSSVAGHKTGLARPLVDNTVPPVISSNSRVRKKSSGERWKCCRSLPSDLSCCMPV